MSSFAVINLTTNKVVGQINNAYDGYDQDYLEQNKDQNLGLIPVAGNFNPIGKMLDANNELVDDPDYVPPVELAPVTPSAHAEKITMRQCRLQLLATGMLDNVDAAIAAIPNAEDAKRARIEWEYSSEVVKSSDWVKTLAAALHMTDEQLTDMFDRAALL